MRLFIAIELSDGMRRELALVSRALKERASGGRFVPVDNMHITLRFLGETADLSGAVAAMREACRGIRPFDLKLGGYGYFEKTASGNHRVSLVTVKGDIGELSVLHETLEAALSDRGFPRDMKRYTPHVTLGRSVEHDELSDAELKKIPLSSGTTVSGITLFESVRVGGRMVYTPLHRERF
ncbi:MAG: RNA 2',3'-cyclic phosphodiesterase [Clostridia bacterium]|nr:RNA 2',3'-cyclic phosphodiesterase [Clostridia bacterium]